MIIVHAEAAIPGFFLKRNVFSFGKLIISNFPTILTYFNRETTKVLGKEQFKKSHFSCRISMANLFNIKNLPQALAGLLVFLSRHTKVLVLLVFSTSKFFAIRFLCVCYIASGAKLCFASEYTIVTLQLCSSCFLSGATLGWLNYTFVCSGVILIGTIFFYVIISLDIRHWDRLGGGGT